MLSAYRVLDLTDERGQLCAHVLAAFGADVIAIESPGGTRSRHLGPFAGDRADPERSLRHWAFNRGKRSVVLDLADAEGRRAFLDLVAGADVLVESAAPGELEALDLGADTLAALNPALVHASITPFGSDGPKADWAATDLTLVAAGGQAWLTGDADRAPLRISEPQAFHHAAADAACGILVALHERLRSGRGQHVDTSAQQSVLQTTQSMVLAHALGATELTRMAGGVKVGPVELQLRWECADGFVSVTFFFGSAIGPFSANLMAWVCEEGFCDEATRDKDWVNYATLLLTGQEPIAEYERVKRLLDGFFLSKTKAELLEASMTRRLLIVPVTTLAEVVDSPQFAARGYWQDVEHGEGVGLVRHPGALAKLSPRPLPSLGRPPRLGEHTAAVLAEPPRRPSVVAEAAAPPSAAPPSAATAPGRPAARGPEGPRLLLGDGRPGRHPRARRPGRHRRTGGVGPSRGHGPHAGALPRRRPRHRRLGPVQQHERREARPGPRPVAARVPRCRPRSRALGRRGRRVVLAPGHAGLGPRLPGAA